MSKALLPFTPTSPKMTEVSMTYAYMTVPTQRSLEGLGFR